MVNLVPKFSILNKLPKKLFSQIIWKGFDLILTLENNNNYHLNAQGYFGNLICVKIKMSVSWYIFNDITHKYFFWTLFDFEKKFIKPYL